jgi:hypothetical protein
MYSIIGQLEESMNSDYRRTTITVPSRLKERMKRAGSQVNWSAIACEAFEKKLDELGPIEEITSIAGALQRMKSIADQQSSLKEPNPDGKAAGKHWAMNYAIPIQLQTMEDLKNGMSTEQWADLMTSRDGPKELARCMEPGRGPGHRPPPKRRRPGRGGPPMRPRREPDMDHHGGGREREIWRSILDRRPESPEFFLGFAEGALEIWKQIKDQL